MLPPFDDLKEVKAFVFDVDGVLSKDTSPIDSSGNPVRTANVKDGLAIRAALTLGFHIAVITGGSMERVRKRHENLGIEFYYDRVRNKVESLQDFLSKTNVDINTVLFMGDDLIDYQVMSMVGVPVCPQDAVTEIKNISKYISPIKGGEGCVRDIIELTLKVQGVWPTEVSLINQVF